MTIENINVRFFISDYSDIEEIDEQGFLAETGNITYERHTVFTNGVKQICLTKHINQ